MPILASLALVAFVFLAPLTPAVADDLSVLHVCVGPAGALLAVAPSGQCPRNHVKVSVPISTPPIGSFYTVERPAETFGPLTVTGASVSCEEGDQVVSGGYVHTKDQPGSPGLG
jgi:hypothetical protein